MSSLRLSASPKRITNAGCAAPVHHVRHRREAARCQLFILLTFVPSILCGVSAGLVQVCALVSRLCALYARCRADIESENRYVCVCTCA
eukprot:4245736-Prymnesium_polylepis.1